MNKQLGESLENPLPHDNLRHKTPLLPVLSSTALSGIA